MWCQILVIATSIDRKCREKWRCDDSSYISSTSSVQFVCNSALYLLSTCNKLKPCIALTMHVYKQYTDVQLEPTWWPTICICSISYHSYYLFCLCTAFIWKQQLIVSAWHLVKIGDNNKWYRYCSNCINFISMQLYLISVIKPKPLVLQLAFITYWQRGIHNTQLLLLLTGYKPRLIKTWYINQGYILSFKSSVLSIF